ncbi:MAG TPA: hypothetical protein VLX85_08145 [Stellaceae bacterium]|nr:hypothetical protein [Stellaceae bacterium]
MGENIEDRRKAAHCRRLAAQAHDPRISDELLRYARELEERADAAEGQMTAGTGAETTP